LSKQAVFDPRYLAQYRNHHEFMIAIVDVRRGSRGKKAFFMAEPFPPVPPLQGSAYSLLLYDAPRYKIVMAQCVMKNE
jgi:hypothetical protein